MLSQRDSTGYVPEQTQKVSPVLSFPSWTVCSGVHQAKDSWPLLDRPFGWRAGAAAPHPRRARPPGLPLQAPSPGSRYLLWASFWVRAQADNKNSPMREIPESGTAFLLSSVTSLYHKLEVRLGHNILFICMLKSLRLSTKFCGLGQLWSYQVVHKKIWAELSPGGFSANSPGCTSSCTLQSLISCALPSWRALAVCVQIRKRHSSGSTSEDRFAASAREYVESLHQNSRTHLLYGKNNVLVQPVSAWGLGWHCRRWWCSWG